MKEALPKDAKISKEARETVQECVSEYISFITSEACERCRNGNRKTINGDDLIFALNQLGFEHYISNLQAYYNKYKDAQKHAEGLRSTGHQGPDGLVNQAQEAVERSKRAGQESDEEEEEDLEEEDDEELVDQSEEAQQQPKKRGRPSLNKK